MMAGSYMPGDSHASGFGGWADGGGGWVREDGRPAEGPHSAPAGPGWAWGLIERGLGGAGGKGMHIPVGQWPAVAGSDEPGTRPTHHRRHHLGTEQLCELWC